MKTRATGCLAALVALTMAAPAPAQPAANAPGKIVTIGRDYRRRPNLRFDKAAFQSASEADKKAVAATLGGHLRHTGDRVRRDAVRWLGDKVLRPYVKPYAAGIAAALTDRSYSVRWAAQRAVVGVASVAKGDAAFLDALKKALASTRSSTALTAAQAMAALGRPSSEFVGALRKGLDIKSCWVSRLQDSAAAMARYVPGGEVEVINLTKDPKIKERCRRGLLQGLARSGAPKALALVINVIRTDKDTKLRSGVLKSVRVRDRKSAKRLVGLLKWALGDSDMREAALERIKTASYYKIAGVGSLFRNVKTLVGQLAWTSRALPALSVFPAKKVIPLVVPYATSKQDSLREAAIRTLGDLTVTNGRHVHRSFAKALPALRKDKAARRVVTKYCAAKLTKSNRALKKACAAP